MLQSNYLPSRKRRLRADGVRLDKITVEYSTPAELLAWLWLQADLLELAAAEERMGATV
jgi:hypothetical protein